MNAHTAVGICPRKAQAMAVRTANAQDISNSRHNSQASTI